MAGVVINLAVQAAEKAVVYIAGALAGIFIADKIVNATKGTEDVFDQKESSGCLNCGTSKDKAATSTAYKSESTEVKEEEEGSSSSEIEHEDIEGKTRDEIRDLAKEKGLESFGDKNDPDYPRKWRDPDTKKERLRLDRGHIDRTTGKPYNDPKAAGDHTHGYDKNGNKIRSRVDNNPHFPNK